MKDDTISRVAAIETVRKAQSIGQAHRMLVQLPSAQQTTLTADDIETIRIHLSAFKETLCNQGRWTEAEEYERLIQRLTGEGGQDNG